MDSYTRIFRDLRVGISYALNPIYLIAETPYFAIQEVQSFLTPRIELLSRNSELEGRNLKLQQMVMQYQSLEEENERMRLMLGVAAKLPFDTRLVEIIGVLPNFSTRFLINKGKADGVQEGMPVVGSFGVVGQVVESDASAGKILLVTDQDSATPVRIRRNKFRSILGGTGNSDLMVLENVPTSAEIYVGDVVETSGLGGRYPAGYPVGKVVLFKINETSPYATVNIEPLHDMRALRDVLVILN